MKRLILTFVLFVLSVATVSAQIVKMDELPSKRKYRKAVKTIMYRTNGHDLTPKRLEAMDITQSVMNRFSRKAWFAYRNEKNMDKVAELERSGVPYFLRKSFDKVCKEVRTTKVKEGTVAVWLVFNMGYVVKTPTSTFAIDLYSKYTDKLLDMVDFGMITHAHGDHNTRSFAQGLAKRGKPILAAFNIKGVNEKRVVDGGVYHFGDITVRVTTGDHNKKLKKFVAAYEIDCGPKSNNTVIYHVGDTGNYTQLNPQKQVDIFIPHMRVSLDIQAAIDNFKPYHVFLSHLQELGHSRHKYRWTFHDALETRGGLKHDHIWIPCWGERVIYNRNDWK